MSQWKKFYCAILLYGQNSGKKGISSVMKEVDEDGEFQIVHVMFTWIVHPIADEISQQVCALKCWQFPWERGMTASFTYMRNTTL